MPENMEKYQTMLDELADEYPQVGDLASELSAELAELPADADLLGEEELPPLPTDIEDEEEELPDLDLSGY